MAPHFIAAEFAAIKAFVKKHAGDESGNLQSAGKTWRDIEGEWESLSVAGGFTTTLTADWLRQKHIKLRRKAVEVFVPWSDVEEKAVLAFIKDRTGNEFASLWCRNPAWKDLEREWPGKGFGTARTTIALGRKYYELRQKASIKGTIFS